MGKSNKFGNPKISIGALHILLEDALLIEADKRFARILIQKLEVMPPDKTARSVYDGLHALLNQDKISRAKITRRFAVKKIDVFQDNLDRFTKKELETICGSCHLLQLTDGCTVACSWCYLSAQPYVNVAMSYESVVRLLTEYGHLLPDPFRLYWASDPLDWYDGEKSYIDLVEAFYAVSDSAVSMVTTTSIPMGTEFTLLRLIKWFDEHLQFAETKTFRGNTQHYLKDNLMKGLYYQKNRKYDIHSLFDYFIKQRFYYRKTRHILKISETDVNYKRLKAIFDVLSIVGISQSCRSWIEVETRDVDGSDGVRKSGRAYKWDNRDPVLDSVSMACWDSAILFPTKVGAMEMCGVTSKTEKGLEFWFVEPGKYILPRERAITLSSYHGTDRNQLKVLLPYSTLIRYDRGVPRRRFVHYSLKRDIQAYGLLLSKTIPSVEFIARETNVPVGTLPIWNEIRQEYVKRKKISDRLLRKENDEEVIRLVYLMTSQIENRLVL